MVDLPDGAWITARDGSRAVGDLEDQAARYHPGRHELTINDDFRAITDLITHWQDRYKGMPGARPAIKLTCGNGASRSSSRSSLPPAPRLGAPSNLRRCSHRRRSRSLCCHATCSTPYCRSAWPRSSGHHAPGRPDESRNSRPARRFARELELPIVCAYKAIRRAAEFAGEFAVAREPDVDLLTLAERLHLANGLLHEA